MNITIDIAANHCLMLHMVGHTQIANEIYMDLVAEMMYPKPNKTPQAINSNASSSSSGASSQQSQLPKTLDRGTLLGYLTCPLRKPTVLGMQSPQMYFVKLYVMLNINL